MPMRPKSMLARVLVVVVALALGFALNLYWSGVPLDGVLGRIAAVFQRSPERAAPASGKEESPAPAPSDPVLSAPLAVEPAPAGGQEAAPASAATETAPPAPESATAASDAAGKETAAPAIPPGSMPESVPPSGQTPPESVVAEVPVTPAPSAEAEKSAPAAPGKTSGRAASKADKPLSAEPKAGPEASGRAACQPGEPGANRLLNITAQDGPDELRITVETQGVPEKTVVHKYKAPARIAVDFPGIWSGPVRPSLPVTSDVVEKIRLGLHPDKLRLVLDCREKDGVPPDPVIERQAKGLVIRVPKARGKTAP